jgi:hypothetical protein
VPDRNLLVARVRAASSLPEVMPEHAAIARIQRPDMVGRSDIEGIDEVQAVGQLASRERHREVGEGDEGSDSSSPYIVLPANSAHQDKLNAESETLLRTPGRW